jgi:2-desacetyl-2-hydroxyethyl bacteriochlorophyllide A dehydrogenase
MERYFKEECVQMKAAVYKGNRTIVVEDAPIPLIGSHDILVKVMACGICGTDVHIFKGSEGAAQTTPPVILGHEFSGIIEKIGSNVKHLKVGDRVTVDPNNMCGSCYYCQNGLAHFCENMIGYGTTVDGGFAQYWAGNSKQAYQLDDSISFIEGAMVEPIACCLHGIDGCEIKAGSTVMIIGGGTIGLIMLQLAKIAGATTVVVLEPIKEKRDMAIKVGADIVIDSFNENVQDILVQHKIKQINTVIECVGLKVTMVDAIKYAGKKSIAMLFGLGNPNDEIPVKPFELFKKEITIKASFINPYTQSRALDILKSGKLDIKTLISHEITLAELADVLADPKKRNSGKVIVNPFK